MGLSENVTALATRVGQEIKAVRAEITSALAGKASTVHNHGASQITSGTIDINRLPVGSDVTKVASGDDPRFVPAGPSPASILNIGSRPGQTHFSLQYARSADSAAVATKHKSKYGAEVTLVYKHALKGYAAKLTSSAGASEPRSPKR